MRSVVIGGGAIGLLLAGQLASAQQRVALIARPHAVAALQQNRLTIESRTGTLAVPLPQVVAAVQELPADYQRPALAIVCVKGYDTPQMLPLLQALKPDQVLTLQNGLGNEERLAAHLGAATVFAGAITSSVQVRSASHIQVTKPGGIGLAPMLLPAAPDSQQLPDVHVWAVLLRDAGFVVQEHTSYQALKWSKVLLNMLANAVPAILDMPVPAVYADARLVELECCAFREALGVMRKQGIAPVNLPAYPVVLLARAIQHMPPPVLYPLLRRLVAGGRGGKLPSLHADVQRGRERSEGETMYGAIAAEARACQLVAPVNATLWRLLHGIATGTLAWEEFRNNPDALLAAVAAARRGATTQE